MSKCCHDSLEKMKETEEEETINKIENFIQKRHIEIQDLGHSKHKPEKCLIEIIKSGFQGIICSNNQNFLNEIKKNGYHIPVFFVKENNLDIAIHRSTINKAITESINKNSKDYITKIIQPPEMSTPDKEGYSFFLNAGKSKPIEGNEKEREFTMIDLETKEKDSFYIIPDPTFDMAFKNLFINNTRLLKSFLSSLVFQNEVFKNGNFKLETFDSITNEFIAILKKAAAEKEEALKKESYKTHKTENGINYEHYFTDIAYKCVFHSSEKDENIFFSLYFDLEMQRSELHSDYSRFLNYTEFIKNKYCDNGEKKGRVFSLVLTNFSFHNDNIVCYYERSKDHIFQAQFDFNSLWTLPFQDDFKECLCMISIPSFIKAIDKGMRLSLSPFDKSIGIEGKEWLKLIGVAHWASYFSKEIDYTNKEGEKVKKEVRFFYIPTKIASESVKEAAKLLSEYITDKKNNKDLIKDQIIYTGIIEHDNYIQKKGQELGEKIGEKIGKKIGEKIGERKSQLSFLVQFFTGNVLKANAKFITEKYTIEEINEFLASNSISIDSKAFINELKDLSIIKQGKP